MGLTADTSTQGLLHWMLLQRKREREIGKKYREREGVMRNRHLEQ